MSVYAIFIFNFYRFVGRKDLFDFDLSRYQQSKLRALRETFHFMGYVGKYLVLFPVVAFSWFAILTTLLAFLVRGQTIDEILLISMAVLSAIRITAYYNEDLSRDLSKILPFAISYFSLSTSLDALLGALLSWKSIVYYLGFMIGLELVMRITTPVLKPLFTQRQSL
jgi:hypothetical protein